MQLMEYLSSDSEQNVKPFVHSILLAHLYKKKSNESVSLSGKS